MNNMNEDKLTPLQSVDGLLTSNVTNKPLDEEVFSAIDTTDDQKKAIRSVLQHIKNRKGIPLDIVLQEIQQQYSLEDIPEMNIEESVWYQLTKNERIGFQQQGFRVDIINGKRVKIPHLSFSSDLDYLDNMINRIIEKIKNIK
jgi:ribosomal protein S3AE